MQRHIRKSAYRVGQMAAAAKLRGVNKKFEAGANPLEFEQKLPVLMPTNQQQLESMTKMLEDLYKNPTPEQQQALDLWKFQVAQGTVGDQIKFDFVRSFYFWLLGRGNEEDHKNTSWGRANVAVYNPEVSNYVDQFARKRMDFAIQLSLLKSRIPESLLGYYLYFKYIVRGKLKVEKDEKTGYSFYDISNEDFLQDWDLFKNVFEQQNEAGTRHRDEDSYATIAKGFSAPQGYKQFESNVPFPATSEGVEKARFAPAPAAENAIDPERLQQKRVSDIDNMMGISRDAQRRASHQEQSSSTILAESIIGTRQPENGSDTLDASAIAPGEAPGEMDDAGFHEFSLNERAADLAALDAEFADMFAEMGAIAEGKKEVTNELKAKQQEYLRRAQVIHLKYHTPRGKYGERREEGRKSSMMTEVQEKERADMQKRLDNLRKSSPPTTPVQGRKPPEIQQTPMGLVGEQREHGRLSSPMTPVSSLRGTPKVNLTQNRTSVTPEVPMTTTRGDVTKTASLLTPEQQSAQRRIEAASLYTPPRELVRSAYAELRKVLDLSPPENKSVLAIVSNAAAMLGEIEGADAAQLEEFGELVKEDIDKLKAVKTSTPAEAREKFGALVKLRRTHQAIVESKYEQMWGGASSSESSAMAKEIAREYGEYGSESYGELGSSELSELAKIDPENAVRAAELAEQEAAKHGESSISSSDSKGKEEEDDDRDDSIVVSDKTESSVARSKSETSASSMTEESSNTVHLEDSSSSAIDLPPLKANRHDQWLPPHARWMQGQEGKIFVEGKQLYKVIDDYNKKDLQRRPQFYLDNPGLTSKAERTTVVGRNNVEYDVLRMDEMKGFISLRDVDKAKLDADERNKLAQALVHAYGKLKYSSYQDVTNLGNIAVAKRPNGDYLVQFYEGGSEGNKSGGTPDEKAANYIARLDNEAGAKEIARAARHFLHKGVAARAAPASPQGIAKGGPMQIRKKR